jgi:hypothetical protein
MLIWEAEAILAAAERDVLEDRAFGDAEIYWMVDGEEIAVAHIGSHSSLTVNATSRFKATRFTGDAAREMRHLGRQRSYQRNDETGDDRNVVV